jgi:glycosyltransferase involved in cell wall biosynthesis
MKISVVISTYNQPEWLCKVLHGYMCQSYADFELIIADDGSDDRTAAVLKEFQNLVRFPIKHVWQEDEGFQKTKILNKAILAAGGDYLVFSDGDCIPRSDFLKVHAELARYGYFLSGGYCKLPMELSLHLTHEDIASGRAFEVSYLKRNGLEDFSPRFRVGLPASLRPLMDRVTPTKATWNGHNASGWKADILAVNGFNESMQYGGEDRELGERLTNLGIQSRQIRHRAILLHLDHKRGYVTPEMILKNLAIRAHVKDSHSVWCPDGILKRPQP